MMSNDDFASTMATLAVPVGFTTELLDAEWPGGTKKYVVKSDDVEITFDQYGERGHTRFKVGDKWCTFDRRGISDSFYWAPMYDGDTKPSLDEQLAEQLKRISDSRAYHTTAIQIPDIPFTVAPDGVQSLKVKLQKHGHIHFTPSGFGTGYTISKNGLGLRDRRRATKKLEEFLGHSPLYITTFDAD